jgi:hypothetical protein
VATGPGGGRVLIRWPFTRAASIDRRRGKKRSRISHFKQAVADNRGGAFVFSASKIIIP